ncbi:uncharacterized protein LOC111608693 isoform X1 [Xiphophorus maculatus]|uniref:uncharacterized protein LOC111608693 isoform X1 n=2 Tax=Xiphophorus maculatus TaxID=8083 RepID=UPI000C6D4E96|nr:uncharacterized protein LOC111608693 isoform X1 [Xiphophorus maculatus]XP_023190248.1 uncharacterized protein LOC111608693 isoform X1 [Xiphophorus maculatus]XP_023190249.1 uncharacterized protein LOC111608693 isoform X1 [Xiphophorus maculatus]XP_023190250.1 uncharacterized protein LOC111608693 isoform X1 [Xiphophorus maculatus]XP_023190251.1 uncharacterized protein LOC111608693 isoform X1 [Xiphophorus maculatus]XP_023190252.1 uncharacterized protein LOC111608693 isoform X1 [Xiphophorus macu
MLRLEGLLKKILCQGLFPWSHSASMLETIVRPGDNITIYCDCKVSTGIYVVWFRNCSHQYQPTLVVDGKMNFHYERKITFPRFKFVKNESSNSFDLMIINVTNSDEGLYYCGTLENKVKQHENKNLFFQEAYLYGNITTKITLYTETHLPHRNISMPVEECGLCRKLLFTLCPVFSALSALLSAFLVYLLCQKSATTKAEKKRGNTLRQTEEAQDENVCYAALEIHQPSQRRVVLWSHLSISTLVVEKTARPGENILLYCDCKQSSGVYIVWYKNSSHEETPTLVLNVKTDFGTEKIFPRFKFLKNFTFDSYDLLIVHASNSDEGLYYCGTEETKVEKVKNKNMLQKTIHQYGNIITKITLDSSVAPSNTTISYEQCGLCWKLLFALCPGVFIFSAFLTLTFGFLLRWKTEMPRDKEEKCDSMKLPEKTEGDDVYFAALEVHLAFQKKKKRMIHTSDFCIFTDVIYNMKVKD